MRRLESADREGWSRRERTDFEAFLAIVTRELNEDSMDGGGLLELGEVRDRLALVGRDGTRTPLSAEPKGETGSAVSSSCDMWRRFALLERGGTRTPLSAVPKGETGSVVSLSCDM